MNTPEKIEGIPTARKCNKERVELITMYFGNLWKKLQKEGRRNCVFNEFLQTDIYIKEHETDKKTTIPSSHDWKATYAIKHIEKVLKYAKNDDITKVYTPVKKTSKTQIKNGYKEEANLYYDFTSDKEYLNFRAYIRIGIKIDRKHILYCVSAVYV